MTDRAAVHAWCDFLRARIAEEQRAAEGAASAPDGTGVPVWTLTEAGEPELGVRAGDDVLLTVRTGRGPWADLVVAEHLVRFQPRRAYADLTAWVNLVDLLDPLGQLRPGGGKRTPHRRPPVRRPLPGPPRLPRAGPAMTSPPRACSAPG
ncbi:DUF6221 family protein [Streptomyces anulatus]|uniref:DUF6221 family protein n=1 Tax=Streptomyces anulatus TaxID=1892 RepID=UPI0038671090